MANAVDQEVWRVHPAHGLANGPKHVRIFLMKEKGPKSAYAHRMKDIPGVMGHLRSL